MRCGIKRGWGKKGMDDKLMFTFWEIMVIFMVVIALTVSVRGIANNTTYWKKYHTADLALMTDLILVNQGDFTVNYDTKDLRKNFMTRILRIDELKFQIFLKNTSYFVYDESIKKDRFPQSYTFASNINIKVVNVNSTSDYVTLYKTGDILNMEQGFSVPEISCPSTDTRGNLSVKNFKAISMSSSLSKYASSITTWLDVLNGNNGGGNDELLIVLSDSSDFTTVYYDTSIQQQKSQKMACLIKRQIAQKRSDVIVKEKPYDNSLEANPFTTERDGYRYWVVISVKGNELSSDELSQSIKSAIIEYYQ